MPFDPNSAKKVGKKSLALTRASQTEIKNYKRKQKYLCVE